MNQDDFPNPQAVPYQMNYQQYNIQNYNQGYF